MNVGKEIREAAIAAANGLKQMHAQGWSIVMTGGPNDPIGRLMDPPLWRLSGKRYDGRRPSRNNLRFLRKVALAAGAPDMRPEELIQGTWHFSWYELADGRHVSTNDYAGKVRDEAGLS